MISMFVEKLFYGFILYSVYVLFRKWKTKGVVNSFGKAVLITGCDSGFGNLLAQTLNRMGFRVYATVFNIESTGAQELKNNSKYSQQMIVWQMNVTNDSEVNDVNEKVKNDLKNSGHVLWAVVNNAGVMTGGLLDWGTLDTYRQVFEVNVFGTVRVTRVFLPLIKQSKGRIINVSSIAGSVIMKRIGIYSMSKISIKAFSETLRQELYNVGVKVISIEPGMFNTQISKPSYFLHHFNTTWDQSSDEVKSFYGTPEEEMINLRLNEMIPKENNLNIAVNDMIDATISLRPSSIYMPMSLLARLFVWSQMYIPSVVIDWGINTSENLLRYSMKIRKNK